MVVRISIPNQYHTCSAGANTLCQGARFSLPPSLPPSRPPSLRPSVRPSLPPSVPSSLPPSLPGLIMCIHASYETGLGFRVSGFGSRSTY